MFSKAQKAHLDSEKLAQKMADRKKRLMAEVAPMDKESVIIEKKASSRRWRMCRAQACKEYFIKENL